MVAGLPPGGQTAGYAELACRIPGEIELVSFCALYQRRAQKKLPPLAIQGRQYNRFWQTFTPSDDPGD